MPHRAALAAVVVILAGCATPMAPEAPASVAFDGLDAPTADEVLDADGARAFVWRGATTDVPDARGADGLARFLIAPFEVDARVALVELNLTSTVGPVGPNSGALGGLEAAVLDDSGVELCAVVAGALRVECSTPLPPGVAGEAEWTVEVRIGGGSVAREREFEARVTLRDARAIVRGDPAAGTDPTITFRATDPGVPGSEPAVGALADGSVVAVLGLAVVKTADLGATWEDVTPLYEAESTLDPMLRADPWTGTVALSHLDVACTRLYLSTDAGASWTRNPAACGVPGGDHQKLALGPPATPLGRAVVHLAYSSPATDGVWAATSLDGGATFLASPVAGQGGSPDPRNTGPLEADRRGNVIMPLVMCEGGGYVAVAASPDRGLSWTLATVDEEARDCAAWDSDSGPAVDAAGTFYAAWHRPSGVKYAYSTDGGASWSAPVDVPDGARRGWVFVDAVAGDAGRLAVAYLATPDSDAPSDFVPGHAAWHAYVTFVDGADTATPTFRTALVAPGDPARRGPICTGWGMLGLCAGASRVLLDFIDTTVTPDGRVVVAYADACEDECPTPAVDGPPRAVVAFLDEGPRLFAGAPPWAS